MDAVVLGGTLAVSCNPQSAIAGLNSFPRPTCSTPLDGYGVLTVGSYAIDNCEPGQVLTEAAISGRFYVP